MAIKICILSVRNKTKNQFIRKYLKLLLNTFTQYKMKYLKMLLIY